MNGELTLLDAEDIPPAEAFLPISLKLSVSEMRSPRMTQLMTYQSEDMLRRVFHRFGIEPHIDLLRASDEEQRIQLARFDKAYLPKDAHIELAMPIMDRVHTVWKAKQFGGEEFRLFWQSNVDVMRGLPLKPLPSCLSDISGLGFCIHGPSLLGRSALIQSISDFLGPAFEVEGDHPAPKRMWVLPRVVVYFPTERTKKDMLRSFRYAILAEIGNAKSKPNALSAIERPDGDNVVIALCTLLNVGLIIIDGAGFLDLNRQTADIFAFLLKLRRQTGIPILFSGTSAFMHSVTFMQNLGTNLFNGEIIRLSPAMLPSINPKTNALKGEWNSECKWLWNQAFRDEPMPRDFPIWTHTAAFARGAWLMQGFHALVKYVISKKGELLPRDLTQAHITHAFTKRLEFFSDAQLAISKGSALAVTEDISDEVKAQNRLTFVKHADHMPDSMWKEGVFKTWMDSYMLARMGRMA